MNYPTFAHTETSESCHSLHRTLLSHSQSAKATSLVNSEKRPSRACIAVIAGILCLVIPALATAKKIRIVTEPVASGRVFIDGVFAGVAPVTKNIRINKNRAVVVTAEKDGAVMEAPGFVTSNQQSSVTVRLIPSTRAYTVTTEPVADGRVLVDGDFIGIAPVTVDLSIVREEPYTISVERAGAVGAWPRTISPTINATNTIVLRLEEDEAMQATVESDISNKWISITPQRTLGGVAIEDTDKTWQKLVSLVTDSFPDLEQIDRGSYYVRSAWRVREYPFRVLRHRLVIKRGVSDDFSFRVLLESQIATRTDGTFREEDFQPTRRIFRSDSQTLGFLRDQL